MSAASLTKLVITANFKIFVGMIGIKNKKDLLALIKREKELREILQQQNHSLEYSAAFDYGADRNQYIGM